MFGSIPQIIRFLIVGSFTFSIDLVVLVILTSYLNIHYLLSAACGFITGSTLNYFLSITFVFESGRFNKRSKEIFLFFFFTIFGLVLNHIIMYVGHGLILLDYKIAKFISLVLVTAFNFTSKKYFVFIN